MHISSLHIQNFRCFKDTTVEFQPGLNVIIGENSAGKTALLTALRLVLDRGAVSLTHDDVHFDALGQEEPPRVSVTITLASDANDTPEDHAVVATWLTTSGERWEAKLAFVYELPSDFHEDYAAARAEVDGSPLEKSQHAYQTMKERRRFVGRYYGGEPANALVAEPEWLAHFQGRYLDALRDAERDLRSGRSALLRQMLHRVLDARETNAAALGEKRKEFREQAALVMANVHGRLHVDHLFDIAVRTWAAVAGTPTLAGALTERDLIEAIVLLLDRTTHRHPVSHGGLGYNNLLYVALVLASVRPLDGEERKRSEAAFHALLVEEPEAHLHPALQYRFLAFLKRQLAEDVRTGRPGSRQVFVTSHSTQVTAAVGLDALRCLYVGSDGVPRVAYPGQAFGPDGAKSKAYVERFLDATKSAMLFAKSVLFVEGIAEQLVLPRLADFELGPDDEPALLDRNYVAVVRVDGVTFQNFLPLFGLTDGDHARYGLLDRRVACVTDGDPSAPSTSAPGAPLLVGERDDEDAADASGQGAARTRSCWPYEPGATNSSVSAKLTALAERYPDRLVVAVAQKTFEYDLAHANPDADCLVTDSVPLRTRPHLRNLFAAERGDPVELKKSEAYLAKRRPADANALAAHPQADDPDAHRRATVATYYLRAVEDAKGVHASDLAAVAAEQLAAPADSRVRLHLPAYAVPAIRWVCTLEPPAEWTT